MKYANNYGNFLMYYNVIKCACERVGVCLCDRNKNIQSSNVILTHFIPTTTVVVVTLSIPTTTVVVVTLSIPTTTVVVVDHLISTMTFVVVDDFFKLFLRQL